MVGAAPQKSTHRRLWVPAFAGTTVSRRRPLRFGAPQVLVEPRHDLDEVARPRAVIELMDQDAIPAVATGAWRAGQAEDEGRARGAGGGAALDGGGADLGVAQHVEGDRETVHPLFEQRLDRFRRHVAPGEAGTAGGDDGIDAGVRN